jgi:hypothetical protein
MKDSLLLFGVTLAKRYTKRQKRIFYSQVVPYFEKLGYSVVFQESQEKLNQASNILIGDIHKASRVVLCPYDTPTTTLFPYKYYPFNWGDNLHQEYADLVLNFLIYAAIGGLLFYFLNYVSGVSPFLKAIGTVLLVILVLFSYALIGGFPNPVNFNKNSASIALLATLAEKMKGNTNTCFVLLDKNTTNSTGLKLLAKDERFKNKFLIYLDCLASGEKFAYVHKQEPGSEALKLLDSLQGLDVLDKAIDKEREKDTNLQLFPRMVHICVGTIEKQKFVVLNTRSKKDYQVDIPRLEKIADGLLNYLKG